VWTGGKVGDNIKNLPISINISLYIRIFRKVRI